jgi:hypothetical protein
MFNFKFVDASSAWCCVPEKFATKFSPTLSSWLIGDLFYDTFSVTRLYSIDDRVSE